MVLFIDQTPGPLMVDILNVFAKDGTDSALFSGEVKEANIKLNTSVKVIKSVKYNRESSINRISTWLLFSIHLILYLLFSKKVKAIIAITNPPIAPIIASWFGRLRKIPVFFIIYDLYPDALIQLGICSRENWLIRFWERQNQISFLRTEKIFTISETMKNAIVKYVLPINVCVIHNWADSDYLKPISKFENPFISENGFEGKRIILYSGNMGLTHDLESVVQAAHILKNQRDVVFVFVGEGAKKAKLKQLVAELEISNVVFLPYQDASMFPYSMASADIGIVTLGKGAEGISVPSKTYTNMAAGLCIIAVAIESSELGSIIRQHQVGRICEPDKPVLLAKTIGELLSDTVMLDNFKSNSLRASESYSRENAELYLKEFLASERNRKTEKLQSV
jgi:glycosyltransferase involved in cell wall biosynthesis